MRSLCCAARSMSRYETMPTFRPLFDHSFVSVLALYAYAAVVSVELDISPAIGRLRIQGSELVGLCYLRGLMWKKGRL